MMRLAWFSPFPPVRSGVAGRSAELVAALRDRGYVIDIYVDRVPAQTQAELASAHDFPWRHRRQPYDLAVYQFGNSSHHDYVWPYALHYPGLAVLHDTRLHHARAALLLRERRTRDYRAEFAANHPDRDPDLAELAVAGFDTALSYTWPMVRLVVQGSRLVAAHGQGAADDVRRVVPGAGDRIVSIRLGEGELVTPAREAEARRRIRGRYAIPDEAVLFGCLGGLTPEKRLTAILDALPAASSAGPVHLLLGGAPAAHYDVHAEIAARALQPHVTVTGYIESDADLTDHIAACDVSLNLRWPTARETSGPWLRALAAGRPTIVTDLIHLGDVPSLDPRTWRANWMPDAGGRMSETGAGAGTAGQTPQLSDLRHPTSDLRHPTSDLRHPTSDLRHPASDLRHPASEIRHPVCVAIDVLDEGHSLRLAMRRLAVDPALRARLGQGARDWWQREHSVHVMVDDYVRVMAEAAARPVTSAPPTSMRGAGGRLRALAEPFGVAGALSRDGFLE